MARAAFTRGERLSLDEAVAYALNQPLPPAATPPSAAASTPLTRRERQVAELVAEGLSDRDIAAKLVISRRTAESHAQNILTKFGLSDRPSSPPGSRRSARHRHPESLLPSRPAHPVLAGRGDVGTSW
jgi:DNA-binding NarL/FixJ family response regulator